MLKIACEITNLLKDERCTIAEATLSLDGKPCIVVTGRAICNPNDHYNEADGVKIATARAKMRAYNKLYKSLSDYESHLYDLLEYVDGVMDNVDDRLAQYQDTINDTAYASEEDEDSDDGDEDMPTDPLEVADKPSSVSAPIATDSDEKDE